MTTLAPITPGELLAEEFLGPMGISQYRLAKEIDVPAQRISEIVAGKRSITADTDLRLCRFFGLSDGYWLRAQVAHDTQVAKTKLSEALGKIRPWRDPHARLGRTEQRRGSDCPTRCAFRQPHTPGVRQHRRSNVGWDIFVQDIPADAASVADVPDDFDPQPIGTRSQVLAVVGEVAPWADTSDPAWVAIDGADFSVEVNLGEEEELMGFAFHARGSDSAAGLIADLLDRLGLRAFDPASDSGLFDIPTAADSMAGWRAYRDQVLGAGW